MDEAAPAAGVGGEADTESVSKGKPSRLPHVPTSLIVTLLGIALTAWLLPAFTRQWDDRQKAHDVQAALATQVATATAHALIRSDVVARRAVAREHRLFAGDNISRLGQLEDRELADQQELERRWMAASIEIQAKLRAYFDSAAVFDQLEQYDKTMGALARVASYPDPEANRTRLFAPQLGLTPRHLYADLQAISGAPTVVADFRGLGFTDISKGVLIQENKLISVILDAHVHGYSTRTRDLLHDLIP